jgi:hydroxyethylthiazole kinase-like uncharacterized protein yjeF
VSAHWSTRVYTADAVRRAEQRALSHATELELMDRAAHAIASEAIEALRARVGRVASQPVVLLVGAGKNGGDALLAGALLRQSGASVRALLLAERVFERGLHEFTRAGGVIVDVYADSGDRARAVVEGAQLVIDGIVGLGASPGLRSPAAALVRAIPADAVVISVDIPSGVDVETGEAPEDHVHADITVTFAGLKSCHVLSPAALACGRVVLTDVGVRMDPEDSLPDLAQASESDVRALLAVPRASDHKYTRGVLGVVAGSDHYPGAAVLAVSGAIRAGVGMVRYVGPERAQNLVLHARPEAVCHSTQTVDTHVQAWAVGSGLVDDDHERAVQTALASRLPCVIDAGSIAVAARVCAERGAAPDGPLPIFTPHAGELAAALSATGSEVSRAEVDAQPRHFAHLLARRCHAVVLLKGSVTMVCDGQRTVLPASRALAWLATAGAGDVLTGIVGALLAGGLAPVRAAVVAATLHAHAADLASQGGPIAALDVADALPRTIAALAAVATRGLAPA